MGTLISNKKELYIKYLIKLWIFFYEKVPQVALLTLTFLEIILGIDNIVFISITAGKLPDDQIKKVTQLVCS